MIEKKIKSLSLVFEDGKELHLDKAGFLRYHLDYPSNDRFVKGEQPKEIYEVRIVVSSE